MLSAKDFNWADLIFVMDHGQRARIWNLYRELDLPPIEILGIEDEYDFMNEELIEILTNRINDTLKIVYKI